MSLMNSLTDGILKCLEEDRKYNFTNELCNHIYDKKISLKKICEICGPYLTSSDRVKRLKAIDLLFNLVLNIKSNGFTDSEVNYLIEFFTGRLTDSFLIQCEISQTIHLLITKWNIDDDKIKGLCFAIKKVEINQQSSEIRFQFYKILGHILKHKLSLVKSMNTEFIFLFLQSVDGEKDPRCLLLVFDLFVFLNQNLDTSSYEEELFELVACYFPIMYNPPKEVNKLHITKEILSERLLACITCNKKFAPYLIQLLIDKFESPLEEVKIYCYQALNQISVDGDYRIFAKYMPDFWNFFKFDLLKKRSKSNFEITNYAENCLRSLTKIYSGDDELIKKWFKMILTDLEACLFNLELNCYLPSTATLSILGLSYAKYFNTICRLLISNSIHNYNLSEETRSEAMQSLSLFADEMHKEKQFKFNNEFNDHHLLLSKISLEKIEILDKYESVSAVFDHLICYQFNLVLDTDSNFLECLIPLRKLLSLDLGLDKKASTKHLNELIELLIYLQNSYPINNQSIEESEKIKETIKIIDSLSRSKSDLMQEIFIPYTLNNLKNNNELLIKALEVCPLNLEQTKLLIDYSLGCFKSNETNVRAELICTLKSQIRRNQTKKFVDLFCDSLMEPLVDLVLEKSDKKSFNDKELILSLIKEICKYLDDEKAMQVQNFIFIVFTNESSKQVPKNSFLNFQYELKNDKLFLRLMESMIRSLKISNEDKEQLKLVYCKLFDNLIATKNQSNLQLLIDLIEICTVKFENTKAIISSLKHTNDTYEDQESRIRYLLVKFYVSITKSYLIVGKDDSQAIIKKLVQILIKEKNLEICKQVIEGIKYIHELDSRFNLENHCKCKSFLNQRFYHQITPLLIKEYNNLDNEDALNNLTIIENERFRFMDEEPETNQTKKIYTRKNTDSYVETMITSIETKIANEKDTENSLINNSPPGNEKKIKVLHNSDVDSGKQSLNLRKNLISNAIFLQISYLPKPMIKVELKRLQKIIVQHSLNLDVLSDCDTLVNNQVEFVKLILEFNSKLLEDKVVNLVNSLLEILASEASNMHVKCRILNCLELIATRLNPVELIKFKGDIINHIQKLLDHRKRLVRYAAVNSISKWTVLGQPI